MLPAVIQANFHANIRAAKTWWTIRYSNFFFGLDGDSGIEIMNGWEKKSLKRIAGEKYFDSGKSPVPVTREFLLRDSLLKK